MTSDTDRRPVAARSRRAGLVGALAAVGLLLACSGGDDGAGPRSDGDRSRPATPDTSTGPEAVPEGGDGFYEPPDPLPTGEPGDLVRYQVVADPPAGVTWYRVMYLSQTVEGEPTVVTGVVTVPTGDPPPGGWKLVTHAHGSTGIADVCAPSVSLDDPDGDRGYAVEVVVLSGIAPAKGYVVASTDYEGLGGPGRHPFLVGPSEGRSVLDAARAARQLPGVAVGPTTAIAGYSQGGHAALWAHQIAAIYAPEMNVVGTMAGAPATDLAATTGSLPPEVQDPFWATLVAGYAAAYPEAEAALDTVLTPAGRAFLDQLDTRCQDGLATAPGERLLRAEPLGTEPWASLLADNVPGHEVGPAPVLLVHGDADRNVPVATSATLLDRLCRAGQPTERRVIPNADHVAAAVPAYEQSLTWFDTLRSGSTPTPTSCPTP
jgi:fermentation-respiration switch protein FrsA (DUF1100 family)